MMDDDRCVRCGTIAKGILGKDFNKCIELFAESKTFRSLWQEADSNYDKQVAGTLVLISPYLSLECGHEGHPHGFKCLNFGMGVNGANKGPLAMCPNSSATAVLMISNNYHKHA